MRRLALLGAVFLAGCAGRTIVPLPYAAPPARAQPRPTHPLTLAVVRLEDRRPAREAPGGDGMYRYRGVDYRGTELEDLGMRPTQPVTVALATHLARARLFERVLVVDRPAEAPQADLVLTGGLVRLRGYVEAEPRVETSSAGDRALPRRLVAEAELGPIEVRAPGKSVPLARFVVGWSFHDQAPPGQVPKPWGVAVRALERALDQLVAGLDGADLSGRSVVRAVSPKPPGPGEPVERVERATPPAWTFERLAEGVPDGWRSTEACPRARWVARQELGFTRTLGPYRPAVVLTWCPPEVALRFDARTDRLEFYVGRDGAGRRWFVGPVGRSALTNAPERVREAFGLTPPSLRHPFVLGPGPVERGPGGSAMVPAGASRTRPSPQRSR